MKRTLSLMMTVLVVFSAFALWTLPASAAAEIVQEDLVSWYDGDDYEGTTWTDKKGDNDITDCVDGTFKDGAYVLDKAQQALPSALYDVLRGDEFTVELNLGAFSNYPDTGYTTWLCNNSGTTAEYVSFYIELRKGTMDTFKAKTSGIASASRPAFTEATETLQDATLSITYKVGGKTNVYVNGVLTASADSPAENANNKAGSNPKFILGNAGTNNCSNTAFEGMRFYSRALTADEVKNNADVDNAPAAPEEPTVGTLTIAPKYDSIGNWRNYTWFIVGYSSDAEANADINNKLKDGTYTLKVVITDETGKTHTISKYAFDHVDEDWGAVGATHWGHDGSYLRICASDYGIAPSADHVYTVAFEIYEGETLKHAGTSADGAFGVNPDNGNSVAWQESGAIVLENPPYLYDEAQPVDPPVVDPIDPPQAGDATAIIAVLAIVALFGAAVVTKKVFVK